MSSGAEKERRRSTYSNEWLRKTPKRMGRGEPAGFLIARTKGSRLYFLVCDAPAESAGGGEKVSSQADLAQVSPGFAGVGHNKEKKGNSRFTFYTAALSAAVTFTTA